MRKISKLSLAFFLLFILLSFSTSIHADEEKNDQDIELWNTLKPLETTTSFLNTGAHPDDERSHLLAYLSRGLGVRSASMIANRGEGGQNEIGNELGNGLGIIRSNEMIEASKITGVEVFHLSETVSDSIYDFGFSKSPEETLENWGEDVTYERMIKLIRTYRPDVVMPSFLDVDSQHGHHRAINQLSLKAFEDAANPEVFPNQLNEGLSPWQVKKLYLPAEDEEQATLGIEIGNEDPIFGKTYPQLGEESRYLHKSQGMGQEIPAESQVEYLDLAKSVKEKPEDESSLFEGIPYDFAEISEQLVQPGSLKAKLKVLQNRLDATVEEYPDRQKALSRSRTALSLVNQLKQDVKKSGLDKQVKEDLLFRLEVKTDQLEQVFKVTSGLEANITIENDTPVRGESTTATLNVKNSGSHMLKDLTANLNVPEGWKIDKKVENDSLKPGESRGIDYTITVADDSDYFNPYDEEVITSTISYEVRGTEVSHKYSPEDVIAVLPKVSIETSPTAIVLNTNDVENTEVKVEAENMSEEDVETDISLTLPNGWEVDKNSKELSLESGEKQLVRFQVNPPQNVKEGDWDIDVTANVEGKEFDQNAQSIDYDHINTSYYIHDTVVKATAFPLSFPEDLKVGYIDGGFDTVAQELQAVGLDIELISEENLKSDDLSKYDTIVTGIRAYLSREDLVNQNHRLLEYVEEGGHAVVQYHKPFDYWDSSETAPYELELGQPSIEWRVTDENADVNVLKPKHAFFNWPNDIDENDWNNWVQERGLYYPMNWDDRFETFVSMADPNEDSFDGGILQADYGDGMYMYSSLVWYRQIQNQVPGGYRMFTNFLSYPLHDDAK